MKLFKHRPTSRLGRVGFTLMEMLVVILIIGILMTYLVVNVPEWLDNANVTANKKNMMEVYNWLVKWQVDHGQSFPKDTGQKFLLRPWKDDYMEHTEQNAKRYFNPKETGEFPPPEFEGMDLAEYLEQWDAVGPEFISYAGFDTAGDSALRRQLVKSPGKTTIMSDRYMIHRNKIVYMTAEGAIHELLKADLEEEYGLDLNTEEVMIGPGSEIPELQTVSNL